MTNVENLERQTHLCLVRPLTKEDKSLWSEDTPFSKYLNELKDLRVKDREYHFACFNQHTKELVASVAIKGLIREDIQSAYIELAKNKKDLGNLVLVEVLAAALDIAFVELKLNRIELIVVDSELQIKQVAKQLAMRSEGVRQAAFLKDDKDMSAIIFAISAKEYQNKNVSKLLKASVNLR